jgi:hypothetical protein
LRSTNKVTIFPLPISSSKGLIVVEIIFPAAPIF